MIFGIHETKEWMALKFEFRLEREFRLATDEEAKAYVEEYGEPPFMRQRSESQIELDNKVDEVKTSLVKKLLDLGITKEEIELLVS